VTQSNWPKRKMPFIIRPSWAQLVQHFINPLGFWKLSVKTKFATNTTHKSKTFIQTSTNSENLIRIPAPNDD
jgi:hypothetical protein